MPPRLLCLCLCAAGLSVAGPLPVWLDVPFVEQVRDGCGSASISMVMRYWGHEGEEADARTIHETLYSPEASGIHAEDMARYFRERGFLTYTFAGEHADLTQHLSKGRPLIVCLRQGGTRHYVVVAGVDAENSLMLLNDPARRKLWKTNQAEFERDWESAGRWTLLAVPERPEVSAELDHDRGMALAITERWSDAREAFAAGMNKAPHDKRFALGLAGVAFRRKDFPEAKRNLRHALRLDPRDSYTNDFLATIYYLEGNLEAALRYWNRAGKPRVERVRTEPQPAVDAALLDRAFAFSPASVLELDQLLTSRARIESLGIFRRHRFELPATGGGEFDLVFRAEERYWREEGTAVRLLSSLRGLPYQTLHADFYNLRRAAATLNSMLRWDPNKRRAFASLSGPLDGDPKMRYRLHVDGRNEQWDLGPSLLDGPPQRFGLKRWRAGAGIESVESGRWGWESGAGVTHRRFAATGEAAALTRGLLASCHAGARRLLLYVPEKRLSLETASRAEAGKMYAAPHGRFARLEGSASATWIPVPRGEAYRMSGSLRSGRMFGSLPLDEYFVLGLERDNDLWLRAHPGTRGGRKGSAPMGTGYLLASWELDRTLYNAGFVRISAGPFFDAGRVYGSPGVSAFKPWLLDTGLQLKVSAAGGAAFVFSYGRDLRGGNNAWYAMSPR